MGLEEYGDGNRIFLKIKHGGIIQESKTEREGYKKIEGEVDGTPYKKWIRPYKAVSGYIDKIERYDREFSGKKMRGWNIHITDGDGHFVLDIPFSTAKLNSRWMKLAEAIDYAKPVRFSAWHDKKSDSMALNVQQDGVAVPQKYTREEPGDMPEAIQRGSGKWDYGAQEDFLIDRLVRFVIPNVELIAANRNNNGTASENQTAGGLEDTDESEFSEQKVKLLRRIRRILPQITKTEDGQAKIREKYFGTSNWKALEALPEDKMEACLDKMEEEEIPF